MTYLMICEKPSLMREVRSCYEKHKSEIQDKVGRIDFVALSGHVCGYYNPEDYPQWNDYKWSDFDYPIIPKNWSIKAIDNVRKKKILVEIKQKVRDYDGIIVGTDSDVEGYGIYYMLENYLCITDMPALRFIEHSLTDKEILESLLNMTDYHKDPVHIRNTQSYLMRSKADWLYGMNATMMVTDKLDEKTRIGRVKAPTLKIVYDNSKAIDNFVVSKYYQLRADYGDFSADYTEDGVNPFKFDKKNDVINAPLKGIVSKKEVEDKSTGAPQLYDLAAIQSEAGQSYGFKPDETLSIIQSLYETHKVISYPRTQCRYVSTEKAKEFKDMLKVMTVFDELKDIVDKVPDSAYEKIMKKKSVVNDVEVQKESHDALLPTTTKPDLNKLNEKEKTICLMIYKRLLAQFLPSLIEQKTTLIIDHGDKMFVAKGKTIKQQGWRVLYKKLKDNELPNVNEGDELVAKEMCIDEKETVPPKRLTQATLLNEMIHISKYIKDAELKKTMNESKGIGTPSTRANIIYQLIEGGDIEEKKGSLYISKKGERYINSISKLNIISPVFAAQMDMSIKQIQRGENDYDTVYNQILKDLTEMCKQIDGIEKKERYIDACCPFCNDSKQMIDGKFNYECKMCGFKVGKVIASRKITEDIVKELVSKKVTKNAYSFKKKDGSDFKSRLKLDENGEVKFDFSSGVNCPTCGKELKLNKGGAFCEEECGFKLFRNCRGHSLTDYEIRILLEGKQVTNIKDFYSKAKDKNYAATIYLEDGEIKFIFPEYKKKD